MNNGILSSITILAGLMATAYGLDSLTVGDITYEDVHLKKEYPSSLFIKHSGGTAFVEKSKLSEDQVASILTGEAPSTGSTNTPPPDGSLVSGDWIYTLDKDAATITGHKNPATDLVIPAQIDGKPVVGAYLQSDKENKITSLKMPDSIKAIGCGAFGGFAALTNVSLGAGLESVGANVFTGSERLEAFEVSDQNQHFSTQDGVLFSKDKTILVRFPPGKSGSYTIPKGTKEISSQALFMANKLTEIIIPEGVEKIGNWAFYMMSPLTNMVIPESAAHGISDGAFGFPPIKGEPNNHLKTISIPKNLQTQEEFNRIGLTEELFNKFVSPVNP